MDRAAEAPRRFGIEEEFLLLDAVTGLPKDRAGELISELAGAVDPVDHEFFSSQIEASTPICRTTDEAVEALTRFRSAAARAGALHGVVVAGTGLPPLGGETAGTVTPEPRYRAIEAEMREAAAHHYSTGLHVHVEIPSRDAGTAVIAHLARWAPVLLAMTANSPVWCGSYTGFASWRHVRNLSWPVAGYPPPFADADAYARTIDGLISSGVIVDAGVVSWVVRLSQRLPTVEVRIADAQLDVRDSVAFAAIVRALVEQSLADERAGHPRPRVAPGLVDAAIWLAARDGLSATLVDPLTACAQPAFTAVERLIDAIEHELARRGDLDEVARYLSRLRGGGAPAQRQLERLRACGVPGLVDLYRSSTAAEAPA